MIYRFLQIVHSITNPFRALGRWLGRIVPGGKRFGGFSFAAKLTLAIWIPLVIAVIILAWNLGMPHMTPQFMEDMQGWMRTVIVVVALIVFPFSTYWTIRLFSAEKIKLYPQIDGPWEQGVEQLQKLGIDPKVLPLILVIGPDSTELSETLHAKSYFKLEIEGVPSGDGQFLSWFAGAKGIFIHLRHTCRTSILQSSVQNASPSPAGGGGGPAPGPIKTIQAESLDVGEFWDQDSDDYGSPTAVGSFESSTEDSNIFGGTIESDHFAMDVDTETTQVDPTQVEIPVGPQDVHEDQIAERLDYVCRLLRRLRGDEVPVDGVLISLPVDSIESNSKQNAMSIHQDLAQLRNQLGANFPVTMLVSEMQQNKGFIQLAALMNRRVDNRFGKRFACESFPTPEQMSQLAKAACESIQDRIYRAYGKPSNDATKLRELFSLLCKIRLGFDQKLETVLTKIGTPPEGTSAQDYHSLTGCYFAATGHPSRGESAFINGVIEKAIANCENTAWTEATQRREIVLKGFASVFVISALTALGATTWLLLSHYGVI